MIGDPAKRRMKWPKERNERITFLWNETDKSASEISRELGVSRNAVIGKARRLGLRMRAERGAKTTDGALVQKIRIRVEKMKPPKPVAPPRPPQPHTQPRKEAVLPIVDGGLTILELPYAGCRAVIQISDGGSLPRYCGQTRKTKSAFCPGHHAEYYRPNEPRMRAR